MELGLKKKRVLITGASRGIGLATARSFLREGANVILVSRSQSPLEKISGDLSTEFLHSKVISISADVTNSSELAHVRKTVVKEVGGLDILISNVGDGRSTADPLPGSDIFASSWKTNFISAENSVREFLDLLNESCGSILFTSSIAGIESIGAPTDYSVAKAALIALSKNLARKLAPKIRVNCVAPGNVFFTGGSWDEKMQKDPERIANLIKNTVPMKRFGNPEEIADAIVFLSSERASFITGACLLVDGGQTVSLH
ncbi:SDR family oxidoreductase [Leptospira sp. 201903070]|uniref:SDR family oxidoreductase n=1 Tax=Leptospira ainlahdjerensis TaxID=2810033 RepID=A0ABS2UAW7_9LEPT|nr:SDR family oxidoreductase [Leptospira ainlahdjerensis]